MSLIKIIKTDPNGMESILYPKYAIDQNDSISKYEKNRKYPLLFWIYRRKICTWLHLPNLTSKYLNYIYYLIGTSLICYLIWYLIKENPLVDNCFYVIFISILFLYYIYYKKKYGTPNKIL